ncbi:MAG: cold shock domain-containing protein [Methyloceanibacter sp.]|jgi:cold shock CspA family protein
MDVSAGRFEVGQHSRQRTSVRGTIKNWFDDKGFGFIRPDDGSADVFAHVKEVAGRQTPPIGAPVEFEQGKDPRSGRQRATNVRLVS